MNQTEIISKLQEAGIFVILRKVPREKLLPLAEALHLGGIRALEITYNTPDAREQLRLLVDQFASTLLIGAGTIFSRKEAHEALSLGAQFLVSPHVAAGMIEEARLRNKVSIAGALTPTEISLALEAGAHFIKIFPAGTVGIEYFKQIRGPFDKTPFMAVGGMNESNIQAFYKEGAIGFGIGSAIVEPKLIESGNYAEITRRCKKLLSLLG